MNLEDEYIDIHDFMVNHDKCKSCNGELVLVEQDGMMICNQCFCQFQYINDNPEIDSQKGNFGYYEKKFYFNVLFEDKAGFQADTEWKMIYDLMLKYEYANYLPDPKWITKY